MKETEFRIQKYKAMLPRARERVIAALMIFMLAIAMMAVSTFSWITLSVAPEVSGATTTIAANGNLEIALAHDILLDENDEPIRDANGNVVAIVPSESAVGDSNLPITQKNLTWGNIVNLSDASYGLENITLRPATLNTSSLLSQPLYSATYGVDGRVKTLISDYRYVQYDTKTGKFVQSDYKGIKAISSVEYTDAAEVQGDAMTLLYNMKLNNASIIASQANVDFRSFEQGKTNYKYMDDSIGGLLSSYADGLLTGVGDNTVCDADDIAGFYDLLVFLDEGVLEPTGQALMEIFDVYQINTYGENYKNHEKYETFSSVDDFCERVNEVLTEMNAVRGSTDGLTVITTTDGVKVGNTSVGNPITYAETITKANNKALYQKINAIFASSNDFRTLFPFIADISRLNDCIELMETNGYVSFNNGETVGSANVTWKDIEPLIDYLVSIDTVLLKVDSDEMTISEWMGSLNLDKCLSLAGVLNKSQSGTAADGVCVTIVDGLIERIDKMLYTGGKGLEIKDVTLTIKKTSLDAKVKEEFPTKAGLINSVTKMYFSNGVSYIHSPIVTDAPATTNKSVMEEDIARAKTLSGYTEVKRVYAAQDTYGLSVDFWLRTNAPQSFLTLEGEVVYTYTDVKVTIDGTEYQVYVTDIKTQAPKVDENGDYVTDENGNNIIEDVVFEDQEVYFAPKKDGEGSIWYYYRGNTPVEGTVTEPGTADKLQTKEVTGYVGANRIWTEEELETMSEMEYRTTQGMGSCYTFYADPGEIGQILEVLKALKVAFVDSNGNLLATASLATEYCFPEYGKYVVPLMLDENAIDTGEDTEEGDDIRAIMSLEQNTPTLLTALVYLDGAIVSNDKVLSSSDIQGQLNLQFGNTYEPQPLEDEDLMSETLKITATVKASGQTDNNLEFYFTDTDKSFPTTVELSVEGEAPKTITANFLRKITTTQGTRQETIIFTQDANDPTKWTATATFTAPGEYILRSVFADGIERKLTNVVDKGNAEAVKVTVHGFSVANFSADKGLSYQYMTAADYVTENFSVDINAYDEQNGTLTPNSVKGVFINEDNVAVTINFTAGNNGHYTGSATFVSDGTYKLENIIVDGLYYSIGSVYTREVRTKLSVAVWLTHDNCGCENIDPDKFTSNANGFEFVYDGETAHEFGVKMKVYDSNGNEITYLNTGLYYSEIPNNVDASLEWNAGEGYYIGEWIIGDVGEYSFNYATVNINGNTETITNAKFAMSIIVMSDKPAQFNAVEILPTEVITIGDNPAAKVGVNLENAKSAVVYGLFAHIDKTGIKHNYIIEALRSDIVENTDGSTNTNYIFTIPKNDGYWKLTDIKVTKIAYTDENGNISFLKEDPFTEESTGIFTDNEKAEAVQINDLSVWNNNESNAKYYSPQVNWDEEYAKISGMNANGTKVVATYVISHNIGKDGGVATVYGKTGDKITAAFLESFDINAIEFTITDFEGKYIANSVELSLQKYVSSTLINGGYTYSSTSEVETTAITTTVNSDNTKFTGNTLKLNVAGTYTPVVKIMFIDGSDVSIELPSLNVYSVTPSVSITAVSPSGSQNAYVSHSRSGRVNQYCTIKTTSYTAGITNSGTVANVCYIGSIETVNVLITKYQYTNLTQPTVTISASNLGGASSATLSFGQTAKIYDKKEGRTVTPYSWTKDGECIRYIGDYTAATGADESRAIAGTLTATELVLTYNGVEYMVPVSITINNPY